MSKCIKCNPEGAQEQPGATRNDWINGQIRRKVRNSRKENFANIFLTLTLFRLWGTSEHCKNVSTRKNEGGSVSCGGVPNFHSQELEKAKKRKLVEQGMESKEGKLVELVVFKRFTLEVSGLRVCLNIVKPTEITSLRFLQI